MNTGVGMVVMLRISGASVIHILAIGRVVRLDQELDCINPCGRGGRKRWEGERGTRSSVFGYASWGLPPAGTGVIGFFSVVIQVK